MTFKLITMLSKPSYLKQARKLVGLSLSDMADIIDLDVSNLSKYERGKLQPTLRVLISYHIITKTALDKLLKNAINELNLVICERLTNLIEQIESDQQSTAHNARIETLGAILQDAITHRND